MIHFINHSGVKYILLINTHELFLLFYGISELDYDYNSQLNHSNRGRTLNLVLLHSFLQTCV